MQERLLTDKSYEVGEEFVPYLNVTQRHGVRLKNLNGQFLKSTEIIENVKTMHTKALDRPPAFIKNFGYENTSLAKLRQWDPPQKKI